MSSTYRVYLVECERGPLYVGMTRRDPGKRFYEHVIAALLVRVPADFEPFAGTYRFSACKRFTFALIARRKLTATVRALSVHVHEGEARAAEREAIKQFRPPCNTCGAPSFAPYRRSPAPQRVVQYGEGKSGRPTAVHSPAHLAALAYLQARKRGPSASV